MSTIQELYDQLDKHDWYYGFSDDHSVWQRGEADRARLHEMAKAIPGGEELMGQFSQHYFTGEPWNNEKQPKPERPALGTYEEKSMEIMFVVIDITNMMRMAAFASYDNAEEYRRDLENAEDCLIEAVEEDEDLFYSINS